MTCKQTEKEKFKQCNLALSLNTIIMVIDADVSLINTLVVKASTVNICELVKKNYGQIFLFFEILEYHKYQRDFQVIKRYPFKLFFSHEFMYVTFTEILIPVIVFIFL